MGQDSLDHYDNTQHRSTLLSVHEDHDEMARATRTDGRRRQLKTGLSLAMSKNTAFVVVRDE